jgi:hypothetical protein
MASRYSKWLAADTVITVRSQAQTFHSRIGMGYSQCCFSELSAIIHRNCSRLEQKGAAKRGLGVERT